MKFKTLVLISMALSATAAYATTPSECISSNNPDEAYLSNVEATLVFDHYGSVRRDQIVKIVADFHDPEYMVTLPNGNQVHITCDDSGDDDCECQVAN